MNFEILTKRYSQERISLSMLKIYVKTGIINQNEYNNIIKSGES